jgi:CO/xanthine dehydrogenase FAD-binding subunit
MHSEVSKYQRPTSLLVALALLNDGFIPIAGGTDYYPGKVGKPLTDNLLDLSCIADFGATQPVGSTDSIRLSGLCTWRQCRNDFDLGRLPIWVAALAQSAKDVGGWQVQNRGTLGGNLCNASPAADGVVALLALGASVVLVSSRYDQSNTAPSLHYRSLALSDFVLGNRQTAKAKGELLTHIELPKHSNRARSVFLKLGHRKYLVISIVMVAVLLDFDDLGSVITCRIAIGSCSKAALRITGLEQLVVGSHRSNLIAIVKENIGLVIDTIQPIDDVRGTALYRLTAAQELVLRAFAEVLA